jgi:hypothetical protein
MPRVEIADKPTFETNDKRAQYARLAVWNHGLEMGYYGKDITVNVVSESNLERAWKDLTGGNYLEGPDGVGTISRLTRNGAEDKSVQERGLTAAYAQEVRPFIRRGLLSSYFGRRNRRKDDKVDEKFEQAKGKVAELMQKAEVAEAVKPKRTRKAPAKPRAKSTKIAEANIKHQNSMV